MLLAMDPSVGSYRDSIRRLLLLCVSWFFYRR
jgi:hypothetical protein